MSLAGLTILVVEDEPIIAISLEDLLAEGGATPVIAGSLAEAERVAAGRSIDAALLDVNVGKTTSYAFAETLRARNIPFIFATGYGSALHPDGFMTVPTVAKPYNLREIEIALAQARG